MPLTASDIVPLTQAAFTQQHRQRELQALEKRAAKLNLTLQPKPT